MKRPTFRLPFGGGAKKAAQIHTALDIGTHTVKWVDIQDSGKLTLSGLGVVPIRKGGGPQGILAAVRDAMRASGSASRSVHTALSGHSVIARYVHFPKMSRDELYSHIEVEADKYIPFNIKDVILDCQVLEEKKEEGKVLALIVAVKKDIVYRHLELLKEAGLEAESLDVDTFAVVNAFERVLGAQSAEAIFATLDIGAKTTNISILRGARSLFSRDVPIGGTDFTRAISEKLHLETEAAEMVKCSPEKSEEELLRLIETPLENLMGEAKLSFDYFENQYNSRASRIYLSGGSSRFRGLLSYIRENVNIDTQVWDPLEGIAVSSRQAQSQVRQFREGLAVAIGLALRGMA